MVVMVMSAVSTNSIRGAADTFWQGEFGLSFLASVGEAGRAGRSGRGGNGPQADLQHEGVTQDRRRRAGGVGIGRYIIGSQHEAIVHIARADDVLIDLVGF